MRQRVIQFLVGFFLAGPVTIAQADDELDKRRVEAATYYESGSTEGGGYQCLMLFADHRWEWWIATCLDSERINRGTYSTEGEMWILIPRWGGGQRSLRQIDHKGATYLLNKEQSNAWSAHPEGYDFSRVLKLHKPEPEERE